MAVERSGRFSNGGFLVNIALGSCRARLCDQRLDGRICQGQPLGGALSTSYLCTSLRNRPSARPRQLTNTLPRTTLPSIGWWEAEVAVRQGPCDWSVA